MFEDEGLLDDAVSAPSAPQGEIGEPSASHVSTRVCVCVCVCVCV